ncbi:MAG: HNH endonuclease [Chloroflexi bacterium]|nr:HNH endonuclease [Chloroflexota bacterium]MCC6895265.1 HNH endonuclease [Anaerolineae bacterium]
MSVIPKRLRQQVRLNAGGRCEYCRRPDYQTAYGHTIDHIVPLKHGGLTILENLVYACLFCNQHKGTDVAVYDLETGLLTPLFNPRTQKWDEHFSVEEVFIVPTTVIGRVSLRLLQMNAPKQVEARAELMAAGLW